MEEPRIYLIDIRLMSEWYCVADDVTEEEFLSWYFGGKNKTAPDNATKGMVAGRMYGGFLCGDNPNRRHLFHNAGAYTYTGYNRLAEKQDRLDFWAESITTQEKASYPIPIAEGNIFTQELEEYYENREKESDQAVSSESAT